MDPIEVQGPDGQRYQFPAGTSPDVMKQAMAKRYPKPMSTTEDVAKSIPSGLVSGAASLFGAPGDVQSIGKGQGYAKRPPPTNKLEAVLEKLVDWTAPPSFPTSEKLISNAEQTTGPLHQPQTGWGKAANRVAQFAPGVFMGGVAAPNALSAGGNVAQQVLPTITAGLGSSGAEQLSEKLGYDKLAPYAGIAGGIAGGMVPSLGRRLFTPNPITPERKAMVDILTQEGVQPTAGQATGRKGLQYLESELGAGSAQRALDNQADQFTAAALRRTGETANRATPDVIDNAFTRIGQQFDDLAARNTLAADPQMGQDLGAAIRDYASLVPQSQQAPIVGDVVTDILGQVQQHQGAIPGAQYQAYRSRIDRAARASRSDPQLSQALQGIRNALDDAMERSISPADAGAWREARNQYRNLLVIEKAATGGGEAAGMGAISPARLRQAAVGQNRRSYVRGQSDFSDLARAGQSILTPLPNSGTAPRSAARAGPAIIGAGLGGGPPAMAAALAATMAPRIAGRVAMSGLGQKYLANQLMKGGMPASEAASRSALLEILMGRLPPALTDEKRK